MKRSPVFKLLPASALLWTSCAAPHVDETANPAPRIVPTDAMTDPLEPVNRGVWAVNRGLLEGVVQPTGRVWRTVVPEPARDSIRHFARNISYPGRLVNHMLQGRWEGAGDESARFLTNTTVGVGGLFDVASRWDMPKSDAHFAQTFMQWGWRPGTYLMLPLLGPSDECHAVGLAGDRFSDPCTYIDALQYFPTVSSFNNLSATADDFARFIESSGDAYADTRLFWTHAATPGKPDMSLRGPVDIPTLETLAMAKIGFEDPEFPNKGRRLRVRVETTGRTIPFNCWMQKDPAPIVYINPGLGGHRKAMLKLNIAEHLHQNGFSVVTTTSTFHPEFMKLAAGTYLPGHPPTDRAELMAMFTAIDHMLERQHPGKLGERSLVGYSMGGFHTLHLAATENQRPADSLRFSRYVAINPPVDLQYGVRKLDNFAAAADAWPESQREARIDNTFLKVVHLANNPPAPGEIIPLDATESKLLIGLTFRMILRDLIFTSQSRHNLGVLENPVSKWRREAVYQEILGFRFEDYFLKMLVPYYAERGVGIADFKREANLRNFTRALSSNRRTRVITNANDFIHTSDDLRWLNSTFGSGRLHVFPNGGHLGNLAEPEFHDALLRALR